MQALGHLSISSTAGQDYTSAEPVPRMEAIQAAALQACPDRFVPDRCSTSTRMHAGVATSYSTSNLYKQHLHALVHSRVHGFNFSSKAVRWCQRTHAGVSECAVRIT